MFVASDFWLAVFLLFMYFQKGMDFKSETSELGMQGQHYPYDRTSQEKTISPNYQNIKKLLKNFQNHVVLRILFSQKILNRSLTSLA